MIGNKVEQLMIRAKLPTGLKLAADLVGQIGRYEECLLIEKQSPLATGSNIHRRNAIGEVKSVSLQSDEHVEYKSHLFGEKKIITHTHYLICSIQMFQGQKAPLGRSAEAIALMSPIPYTKFQKAVNWLKFWDRANPVFKQQEEVCSVNFIRLV